MNVDYWKKTEDFLSVFFLSMSLASRLMYCLLASGDVSLPFSGQFLDHVDFLTTNHAQFGHKF